MGSGDDGMLCVVRRVEGVMGGFGGVWGVVGGWGVDLFLGRVTREHKDVEVAVMREDQGALRECLRGWRWEKVVEGKWEEWREGEWLMLPVHEVHGRGVVDGEEVGMEFLLNEREGAGSG